MKVRKCSEILTTGSQGQPVVRVVDGFVHVHIGDQEYVLSAVLADELQTSLEYASRLAFKAS